MLAVKGQNSKDMSPSNTRKILPSQKSPSYCIRSVSKSPNPCFYSTRKSSRVPSENICRTITEAGDEFSRYDAESGEEYPKNETGDDTGVNEQIRNKPSLFLR